MSTSAVDLHHASRRQLLTVARDALRIAGRASAARPSPAWDADLGQLIGTVSETVDALDVALRELARLVEQECDAGRVVVVDGIFAGDTRAAADAIGLWIQRGRDGLDEARAAVVNAHIAAGGLASAS